METVFDRARIEDYDEVLDFANYVFSHAHSPTDFRVLLPKLFKPEYFMDGINYLAREGGKIKALVGSYPLEIKFGSKGISLPGRGIGTVSVHPYCRSKGYMKTIMKMAVEDMKRDGIVFSCLGGQRQRYEYFGYTLAGIIHNFSCNTANISHTLGREWKSGFSLKELGATDSDSLNRIHAMHEAKSVRAGRDREKLFDILSSWKAKTLVVSEGGNFAGYIVHQSGKTISEIYLKDFSRLPEVLGLFLKEQESDSTAVYATAHEHEKIACLSGFAESHRQGAAYQFAVLDHEKFANAFIKQKACTGEIREGDFVFRVEDKTMDGTTGSAIRLFAGKDGCGAEKTDRKPNLKMTGIEAVRFLACSTTALTHPAIRESGFLRDALPLPVFWEKADGV